MTLLFDAPPIFELPLSKGADLLVTFVYKPLVVDENGDPVLDAAGHKQFAEADYPVGSAVQLVIDTDTPITVDATIVGSRATIWEDKATAEAVVTGKFWRAVITFAGGLDQVMCNGTTVRSDGRKPK